MYSGMNSRKTNIIYTNSIHVLICISMHYWKFKYTEDVTLHCGGPVVSKTTFACHIEFGSAIAKLDIRHCVIRKYTVARSVSDHPVRSPIGVVRSVITPCGHRSEWCGL